MVDPAAQEDRGTVRFGATVELADEEDARRIVTIVGDDECRRQRRADRLERSNRPGADRRARSATSGSSRLPGGDKSYEVIAISYPD